MLRSVVRQSSTRSGLHPWPSMTVALPHTTADGASNGHAGRRGYAKPPVGKKGGKPGAAEAIDPEELERRRQAWKEQNLKEFNEMYQQARQLDAPQPEQELKDPESPVLLESFINGKVVTLNRPKQLNALNLEMVELLQPRYKGWIKDPWVKFVILKGSGGKAFCAGGDIRAIYEAGSKRMKFKFPEFKDVDLTRRFFEEEYFLNYRIGMFNKAHISLLNGITMGGGVGLSVHGSHRVAMQNTLFAMPETGIGFFCDVGGSHFLPRLKGGFELGMYLALTGARLKGYDNLRAGVATHYVNGTKMDEMLTELTAIWEAKDIDPILEAYSLKEDPEAKDKSEILVHEDAIRRCFSKPSVEEILMALQKEGTDWAQKTVHTMLKMSPTSLKVVFKQLHEGKKLSLEECLKMEFRLSQSFMRGHDFYEGVRALLVDKTNMPKWSPASLEKVKDEDVDKYFGPLKRELSLEETPLK
ncbi:3-hydroxyisobutyryl-CoA hydrolase [Balamuthia mandrillaris]